MSTKIIATIWKKPFPRDKILKMIEAGADILRIKCSHDSTDNIINVFHQAKTLISELNKPISLLADLPEAKIRLGNILQNSEIAQEGQFYHLKFAKESESIKKFIPVELNNIGQCVNLGEKLIFGDGELVCEVKKIINDNEILIKALNTCPIIRKSGIFFSYVDQLDHLTETVKELCSRLAEVQPEYVAFSFINSREMLRRAKNLLENSYSWRPKIIAKIESRKGIENIEEIAKEADIIMIARGDLTLDIPFEQLPLVQKELCLKTHKNNKEVIVATEILDSMNQRIIPSRADICDLANIVLDGADYIMMCRVTAHSQNPELAISAAKKIITAVENKF